jgi:hypothetical protein
MGRQQRGDVSAAMSTGRGGTGRRKTRDRTQTRGHTLRLAWPAAARSLSTTGSRTPTVQSMARRTPEQLTPPTPPSSIRTGETAKAKPFFKRKSVGQAVSGAALVRYVVQNIASLSPGWAAVVTTKQYWTSIAAGMDQSGGLSPFLLPSPPFRLSVVVPGNALVLQCSTTRAETEKRMGRGGEG